MAIDKIFNDGNVDGIADNIFNAVNNSVSEVKQMQQRKAAENAQMVVQSLKKIDTDIREKYDNVTTTLEKRIITIKDGRDGIDGKDGRDGKNGKDGRDGKDGKTGPQGPKGQDGIDGLDGVSVVNAHIDFDGSLIIDLSTGTAINVGEVVSSDLQERIKIVTSGGAGGGGGSGTVSSVAISGGSTGLTTSGGPITTSGTITLAGILAKANGGTGTATPSLVAGTNITVSGTWPNQTIAASGGSGSVTSVAATVPSFLSVSGSPITSSGTLAITLSGTALPVANGGTGATTAGAALTSLGAIGSIASADASIVVTQVGSAIDLAVSQTSPASVLVEQVRNATGATLTKGTAVYISGATGQIPTVSKALATGDSTSAQTLGVITADISNNSNGYVTIIGLVSNLDTSAYTDGAQLYLRAATAGTLTATKPYAPQHLVYVAVVAHAHPTQGKLLVKVQNGYELDELHNVSAQSPTTGQTIVWNGTTSLWEKNTVSLTAGVNGTLPIANGGTGSTSTTFVNAATNVTGTLPVANGGTGATTLAGANIPVVNAANTFTATQTFSGSSSTLAMVLNDVAEVTTVSATAATGTINYDITTQSVLYYTSNASANWTVNFRGSSGTSLDTLMSTGQSMTVAFLVTQGATAYYNSAVQVDGTTSGVTTRWLGGAPTAGNASGIDSYRYLIIKTGSATFTVLASNTQFKA